MLLYLPTRLAGFAFGVKIAGLTCHQHPMASVVFVGGVVTQKSLDKFQ